MSQRVLIVDDEPDIRQLIALMLAKEGYDTCEVPGGQQCLALVNTQPVDLVILDVMMPEMDGWETCRQIKTNPATRDIPVMILTIRNQPIDHVIGVEVVCADAYITKPFERRELLNAVRTLLETKARRPSPAAC